MSLSSLRHLSIVLFAIALCSPAVAQESDSGPGLVPVPDLVAEPDFGGRWYSQFGYLELVQTGRDVQGTYSCCQGEITGQIKGPMLEFFWKDPIYGNGWGHFYLREEGRKIVGGWGKEDDMGVRGPWNAVRFEEPDLPGEAAAYRVVSSHPQLGELEATAQILLTGNRVSGTLRGAYQTTVRDLPFRQEVFHRLEGTREEDRLTLRWQDPIDEETGEIALTRTESRLVGSWQPIGADSPLEISFAPAEDTDTATETHAPPREVADTTGPAPVRYEEGG